MGVEPDADDEAVHAAMAVWLVRCDGNSDAIPRDVASAYQFLAVPTNRQHYRDLLEACENGHSLEFAPEQHASLQMLCRLTEIAAYPDLHRKNTFHFRRPDQPAPTWLQGPVEQPVVIRDDSSLLWRFMTLRLFRGASPRRKLALVFVYAVVALLVMGGIEWAVKGRDRSRFATFAIGSSPAAIEEARNRALRESILTKKPAAEAVIDSLGAAMDKLKEDFKRVVGMDIEKADASGAEKPRALDLAIIRSDSVREAWTSLLAARISPDELESKRSTVQAIGRSADSGRFRAQDEETLMQIIEWGQGREATVQSQAQNIEHLRVMLAAETFDMAGSDQERSSP
ncbi:MAG: hypothetical protein DCC65_07870 [Planctomycetota bacterium]|nr:MAG: hypothetical protein DCC65_07870 [Planctomycetota bacterium]